MNRLLATILCLALASLIGVADGGDKAAPKLDGKWIETGATADGKKLPEGLVSQRKIVFVFKKGKYTFSVEGKEFEAGTFKIDAGKTPLAIDLNDNEGFEKTGLKLGVLKLDGKTLALSFNIFNRKKRPANLEGGKDIAVHFLKRE
jgi:uncharacterized protein (TIGR03067 family)